MKDLKELRNCFSKLVVILDEMIAIEDGTAGDTSEEKQEELAAKLVVQLMKLEQLKG